YRIKGYVDFGPHDTRNRYSVHAVGRFLRFYPEPWAPGDEPRLTQLVLIGTGIDAAALTKELEACKDDAPRADEHSMWGVLRYVPDKEQEAGEPDPSYDTP
ncbi:cobalamin biosynthesis protein CobW, partial [Streptomyces sp. JV178]